jgi:hypothetical protein
MLSLLLFVSACQLTTSKHDSEEVDPGIPSDGWQVQVVRMQHSGLWLRVDVSPAFEWPANVKYRVDLVPQQGSVREGMAWLAADSRSAVFPLNTTILEAELELALSNGVIPVQQTDSVAVNAAIAILDGSGHLMIDQLQELASLISITEIQAPGSLEDILAHQVVLSPFIRIRAIVAQRQAKAPQNPNKYTWGTRVTAANDPCIGKTPEQCVHDRLVAFREKICNPIRNGLPNPGRFSLMCIRLASGLGLEPPKTNVVCGTIPGEEGEAGVTAGWTDLNTRYIYINGEAFLANDCPESTWVHEDQHVVDGATGAIPNLLEFARWEKRYREARSRLSAAIITGDAAAANRASRDMAEAYFNIQRLEKAAGKEKLKTECNALFATLDNADLFAFPGAGDTWVMTAIKDMMGELANERKAFNLPIFSNPELCACYTRMDDFISGYPKLASRFSAEEFGDSGRTCSFVLSALKAAACR